MSTTYRLRLCNNSNSFEQFALYQNDPDLGTYDLISLAWIVKGAHPCQHLCYEWTIDYSVMWSESGLTGAGNAVRFEIGQEVPVDPSDTDQNGVELTGLNGVPKLQKAKLSVGTSQPGNVYINELSTLPDSGAGMIGLAMAGKPAYAAPAARNRLHVLTPHPTYYLAAGTFEAGVAVDAEELSSHALPIVYANGVFDISVEFDRGREWHLTETPV